MKDWRMNRPEGSESSVGGERGQAAWELHCNSSSLHIAATDNTIRSFKHKQDGQLSHHIRRIPKTQWNPDVWNRTNTTPDTCQYPDAITIWDSFFRQANTFSLLQTLHTSSCSAEPASSVGTKDAFPLDVQRLVLKRAHSLEFSAEVINAWSLTSTQTSLWHNVYQAYG
jgi:hypothetical protein